LFITNYARHSQYPDRILISRKISGFSCLALALHDHQVIVDELFASLPQESPFAKSPGPGPAQGTSQERRAYFSREQARYMDWRH
jgi:hypothetical protein